MKRYARYQIVRGLKIKYKVYISEFINQKYNSDFSQHSLETGHAYVKQFYSLNVLHINYKKKNSQFLKQSHIYRRVEGNICKSHRGGYNPIFDIYLGNKLRSRTTQYFNPQLACSEPSSTISSTPPLQDNKIEQHITSACS